MTLRFSFPRQQLLFVATCILSVLAGAAKGQDVLIKTDGSQQLGKILGATPAGVQIQITVGGGASTLTQPMATIKEARMAVIPPEFAQAQKALEARNYDAALAALKVVEKFKGLPADWAQQATALVGDVYIEKGDVPKAEAAFAEFQKLYPTSAQAELGLAKLAVAKKDFAAAKAKLEPVLAKAAEDKNVNQRSGFAYGQAYMLMGQVKESAGDLQGALECYLKTVALFYYDRAAVAQAQQKADALRQAHPAVFIP
ncbi:MAG TPA: tetratricopeptide repeat protein [Chthoniobacteraceae bacterium]|jgi:tetratricopeptide (TPR) repeat protein|nr:tetratricopeptide repeat protein [Chthoniobacteraceae bacterium]